MAEAGDKETAEPDLPETEQEGSNGSSHSGFLARLKEYKELIGIMVFFAGGLVWIYTTFATKVSVAQMRCILGATMLRLDNEAQSRNLQLEIISRNVILAKLLQNHSQPDIVIEETEKATIADLDKKKKMADETAKKASTDGEECNK